MKKTLLFLMSISCGSLFCVNNFGKKESATFFGSASLRDQKYQKLTISGAADLENVSAQYVKISGSLGAQECEFDELSVSGSADLAHLKVAKRLQASGACAMLQSQILGTVSVFGDLDVRKSEIRGDVSVHGKGSFDDSKINNIDYSGSLLEFKDSVVHGVVTVCKPGKPWCLWFFCWGEPKKQIIVLKNSII